MKLITPTLRLGLLFANALCTVDRAVAQCPAPDGYEPNDSCVAATPLANGSYFTLSVDGSGSVVNDDYYLVNLPVGEVLTVDCTFLNANGDIDVYLYDPATSLACGGEAIGDYLARGYSSTDNETVSYANPNAVPMTVIVRVELFSVTVCNDYGLNIATAPDPCVTAVDDALEQNDSCATAVSLAVGAHAALFTSISDGDHYALGLQGGETLTVDVAYTGSTDVDLELYDDLACTNLVSSSFSAGGTGQVTWSNTTGVPATLVLRAVPNAGTGACNHYDLNVTVVLDPCQDPLADDGLEDNDTCANPVQLFDGLTTGLFVSKADEDFFEVSVADQDLLTVNLYASVVPGDIDLYLYDSNSNCGDLSSYLVRGYTSTDDETVSWTNTTGAPQTYYIQVVVWAVSSGDCNDYDLEIIGAGGAFATPFCFGDGSGVPCPCLNESTPGSGEGCRSSLGHGAILTSGGSPVIASDDITFSVLQARPGQLGMLIQGTSQLGGMPFKDGVFCMGQPTERIEAISLDANGEGQTTSSIATEGAVAPGETRYYQYWYPDPGGVSPCGNSSNFTNGLIVIYS